MLILTPVCAPSLISSILPPAASMRAVAASTAAGSVVAPCRPRAAPGARRRRRVHDIERDHEALVVGTVDDRAGAAGTTGQESADARLGGRRVHPELLAGLPRGLLQRGHGCASLRDDVAVADLD